jgi:Fic-DOC domain mobile mystery protein B
VDGIEKTLPGETPIDDISGLRIKGISTRAELNAAEAENVLKATLKYLAGRPSRRMAPFSVAWLLKLHREMFGEVWSWAGEIRTCDLNIGVSFYQVRQELLVLADDLATWRQFGHDFVEQAARLHFRSVRIHPFLNGNGRWARMLANILLKQNRSPIIEWPEAVIGTESTIRSEYIAAIKEADRGDDGPLIALHRRFFGSQ